MKDSKIEWTDHTFNPWIGCTKVSPGCAHCYAEARDQRFSKGVHWGKGAPRQRTSAANWKNPLKWNKAAELPENMECAVCGSTFGFGLNADGFCETCEVRGFPIRQRVFCASLADWLDDEVPIEWLADLLVLIRSTPNLDWLLLTKRPENWSARLEAASSFNGVRGSSGDDWNVTAGWGNAWTNGDLPPANVWIGTTVEDQERANKRIPALMKIPARVRFLSCEPLLGPVDLTRTPFRDGPLNMRDGSALYVGDEGGVDYAWSKRGMIQWVICGGESGAGARPMNPAWARSLLDQCVDAGVSFFFKQWGEFNSDGARVGKGAAGRELDGLTFSQFPKL